MSLNIHLNFMPLAQGVGAWECWGQGHLLCHNAALLSLPFKQPFWDHIVYVVYVGLVILISYLPSCSLLKWPWVCVQINVLPHSAQCLALILNGAWTSLSFHQSNQVIWQVSTNLLNLSVAPVTSLKHMGTFESSSSDSELLSPSMPAI